MSSVRAIAASLDEITRRASEVSPLDWAAANVGMPSIAPTILDFATGGTAACSGGRSCAKTYLALQGLAIPLTETTTGMDEARREWWLRAMAEHVTGQWRGNENGMKAIAAAQPLIWEQAQAATRAWEEIAKEREIRFQDGE
jgi:hypothetical protein